MKLIFLIILITKGICKLGDNNYFEALNKISVKTQSSDGSDKSSKQSANKNSYLKLDTISDYYQVQQKKEKEKMSQQNGKDSQQLKEVEYIKPSDNEEKQTHYMKVEYSKQQQDNDYQQSSNSFDQTPSFKNERGNANMVMSNDSPSIYNKVLDKVQTSVQYSQQNDLEDIQKSENKDSKYEQSVFKNIYEESPIIMIQDTSRQKKKDDGLSISKMKANEIIKNNKKQKQKSLLQKQLEMQKDMGKMRFKKKNQLDLQIKTRHYLEDLEENMAGYGSEDIMKVKNQGQEKNPNKLDNYLKSLQENEVKPSHKYSQLDNYIDSISDGLKNTVVSKPISQQSMMSKLDQYLSKVKVPQSDQYVQSINLDNSQYGFMRFKQIDEPFRQIDQYDMGSQLLQKMDKIEQLLTKVLSP